MKMVGLAVLIDQYIEIRGNEHLHIILDRLPVGLKAVLLQHLTQIIGADGVVIIGVFIQVSLQKQQSGFGCHSLSPIAFSESTQYVFKIFSLLKSNI